MYEKKVNKSKYKIEYLGAKFSKDLKPYKIILIGSYEVGKASNIHKLMSKDVKKEYEPTMSMDIKNLQFKVNDKIIQIQMWNSCGSDKFLQSTPNLFKNAFIEI